MMSGRMGWIIGRQLSDQVSDGDTQAQTRTANLQADEGWIRCRGDCRQEQNISLPEHSLSIPTERPVHMWESMNHQSERTERQELYSSMQSV